MQANGSINGGGDGGALYLGLWASNVTLTTTNFTRNSAVGRGGAINIVAIESSVSLDRTIATQNNAGDVKGAADAPQDTALMRRSVASEGGGVALQGSDAHLNLTSVNLSGNSAGRVSEWALGLGLGV